MSQATYGLHGRKIKVQLLKEKEPGNCKGKKCGVISLEEVISLSVTVYFPDTLFIMTLFKTFTSDNKRVLCTASYNCELSKAV